MVCSSPCFSTQIHDASSWVPLPSSFCPTPLVPCFLSSPSSFSELWNALALAVYLKVSRMRVPGRVQWTGLPLPFLYLRSMESHASSAMAVSLYSCFTGSLNSALFFVCFWNCSSHPPLEVFVCPCLTSQCSPRLHPYALWLFPPWMLEAIFILNSSCYAYVCKWGLASDLFPLELRVCVFKCFLISVSSRDPQMQCVHSWVSLPLLFPLPFLYHQSPNAAYCLPKWFLYLFFQRFIVLFLFGAADTCSIIGVH